MGNPYYVTYNNGKPTPVAYQRAFYTNNQSNNATSGISRDAPEVYDVTGGQYSCGRDIHALGAGDYGANSLGATWNRIVDWASSDQGQIVIENTLGVLSVVGIAAAFFVASPIAAGVLLGAGVSSLIGGSINKSNGGSFVAGWVGGAISGALTGGGLATAGTMITSAGFVSASVESAVAGGVGGFTGSVVTQLIDSEQVNLNNAMNSGVVNGITSGIAAPFTVLPPVFGEGVIVAERIASSFFEVIFDSISATASTNATGG